MASDRTRELAKGWMEQASHRYHRHDVTGMGPDCEVCVESLAALLDAFERETTEPWRKALRDVLTLLDEGKLVRDISHDHESDWAIKQLPMIRTLANAAELAGLLEPAAQPTPKVKK